jgi:hypothetical protein
MKPEELAQKCRTVDEARNLIRNARARGNELVAVAAERRLFELQGQIHDDPKDPLVRAVWEGISAYESVVLSRKHGRNVPAARTRQFVRNHGAYKALLLWARRKQPSERFKGLIGAGHPEITAEYFVAVTFADRFPNDARENAQKQLREVGVELPTDLRSA